MTHLDEFTLHEYLDNALDEAAQHEVSTHLAACPTCQAQLTGLESLFLSLDTLTEIPLPSDLSARVIAQIAPAKTLAWLRPVIAMQTVFALVLLISRLPTWLNSFGGITTTYWSALQTEWANALSQWTPALPEVTVTEQLTLFWDSLALANFGVVAPAGLWLTILLIAIAGLFIGNTLLLNTPQLTLETG